VPTLIVLNGPPGIGKTTLARRYVEDHPMSLALEQDVVRGLLGGWRTREKESGQAARSLCLEMARTHLRAGHNVIVPQFIALPSYLDELAQVGADLPLDTSSLCCWTMPRHRSGVFTSGSMTRSGVSTSG